MGKKKVIFLLLFMLLSNNQLFSQELFTKKMLWASQDSIETLTFINKDKIKEWADNLGSFASVQSEEYCIKDSNIFILIVDKCSGIPCLSFYIFKEKDGIWELQATSQARSTEKLNIRVDNDQEKMIFETKSGQIGELSFKVLLQ